MTDRFDHDVTRGTVTCQDCAFTFDAFHVNTDGTYSCPLCGEHDAKQEIVRLRADVASLQEAAGHPRRRPMPEDRTGGLKRFAIHTIDGDAKGYIIHNCYLDGTLGEIVIVMAGGGLLAGAMGNLSLVISLALQHGVPLALLVEKLVGQSYEPSGRTDDPKIRTARSVVDFVARFLASRYLDGDPGAAREEPARVVHAPAVEVAHAPGPPRVVALCNATGDLFFAVGETATVTCAECRALATVRSDGPADAK